VAAEEDKADGICTRCGLCCNGALFDRVQVSGDAPDRLAKIGFELSHSSAGEAAGEASIPFPCAMLSGTRCTVYADRPIKCAAFRCELLRSYESGAIARDEALDRIATAKSLLARVAATMPAGWTFPQARQHWRGRMANATAGDNLATGEFMMQMSLTNIFLDRYFYSEGKRQLEMQEAR